MKTGKSKKWKVGKMYKLPDGDYFWPISHKQEYMGELKPPVITETYATDDQIEKLKEGIEQISQQNLKQPIFLVMVNSDGSLSDIHISSNNVDNHGK